MSKSESKAFKGVVGRTPNQKKFIQTVNEKDFTLLQGCWGTGKSWISVGLACEYLIKGKVDKVVFVRSSFGLVKDLGYNAGDWQY